MHCPSTLSIVTTRTHTHNRRLDLPKEEWEPFAFWSQDKLYTRNLVATDNKVGLWGPLLVCACVRAWIACWSAGLL